VDVGKVTVLRELLAGSDWVERTDEFAGAMRAATRRNDGLLLMGTPEYEPWHLAAHLDDEATFSGAVDLRPTLVRWDTGTATAPHLRVGLDRLASVRRGEPLLVVSPGLAGQSLLERVDVARRSGSRLFALSAKDPDLDGLVHESLELGTAEPSPVEVDLDLAQHLLSLSAATQTGLPDGWRRSLRRTLDRLCGT
jgi:hypothetical protein